MFQPLHIFDENYYQLPDKKIYQGTWDKNGKAIGYGKLYYLDQGFYEGFLEDFEPKGNGRYITLTNEIYEGKFDGLKKMQGLLINDEGIKVSGTFIDWTTEGNGEELWTDKTTFIGNYINGQKNGHGLTKKASFLRVMKGNSEIITLMVEEYIYGEIRRNMMGNGKMGK